MIIVINEVNPISWQPIRGIDLEVEEKDLELPLEDFVERYVKPAFESLIAAHKAA